MHWTINTVSSLTIVFCLNYFLKHETRNFWWKFCEAKAILGRNKILDGNDSNTKEEKKKVVLFKICLPLPGAAQHFAAFLSDFLWVISFCRVTAPLGANTRSRLLIAAAAVVDLDIKCTAKNTEPKTINASTPQWLKISLWVALFNLLRVSGYAWKPKLTWKSILVFVRTGWGHFSNFDILKVVRQINTLLSSYENLVFWASSGFGFMSISRFL